MKTLNELTEEEKRKLDEIILYRFAEKVFDQHNNNYPNGTITKISIQDTYGTTITIRY